MRLLLAVSIIIILISCNSDGKKVMKHSNIHEAEVLEVTEAGGYTYLKVKEENNELWLATNSIEIEAGEKVYYEGGMTLENFESENLGKTFEKILFLDKISKDPKMFEAKKESENSGTDVMFQHHQSNLKTSKIKLNLEPVEGGITIADLYANKKKYKGKKVKVTGQVTKFNDSIMNTNWIHIQDGTEYDNNFDLTANSDEFVKVGDTVILEGKVELDKDLGHGYAYEVILEKAKLIYN